MYQPRYERYLKSKKVEGLPRECKHPPEFIKNIPHTHGILYDRVCTKCYVVLSQFAAKSNSGCTTVKRLLFKR